jgi:hypothetical protein
MVRDNNSDKGTYKKLKNSRMNLNSNTLYEFNTEEEGEDLMIFFLGGKLFKNKQR